MSVKYIPMSTPDISSIRKDMLVRIDDDIQDDSLLDPKPEENTYPTSDAGEKLLDPDIPADPTGEDIAKAALQETGYNPAFSSSSPVSAIDHDKTDLQQNTEEESLLGSDDTSQDNVMKTTDAPFEIPSEMMPVVESPVHFASDCEEYYNEAAMKAKVRNQLPDSEFGIPRLRKYPLNDEKHVRMAVSMFSHCKDPKDKALLAKKIFAKIDELKIDIKIGKNSALYEYAPKSLQETSILPVLNEEETEVKVHGMDKSLDKRTKKEIAEEHISRNLLFYNNLFYNPEFAKSIKAISEFTFFDYFYPSFKTHGFYTRMKTALGGIALDPEVYTRFGMQFPLATAYGIGENWPHIVDEEQFWIFIDGISQEDGTWFHVNTADDKDHVKYCLTLYSVMREIMNDPCFHMEQLSPKHLGILTDWFQQVIYNWDLMSVEEPLSPRYLYYAQRLHDLFWDCTDNPLDPTIAASNIISMVRQMAATKDMVVNMNETSDKPLKLDHKLFHLSQSNMDGATIEPRIPDNYFTKNGYEDGKTKRVCFTPTIGKCLMAMSQKCTDMELFVMVPDGKYQVYRPSVKEVPDSKITKEVWIKEPVKLMCIGKIKVIGDAGKDGHEYTYGDGKKAELYDWTWKWIETYKGFKPVNEGAELISKEACAGYMVHELGFEDDLFLLPDTLEYPIFSKGSVRLAMDMITRVPKENIATYTKNLNRKYKELGCTFSISVDHPYAKYADQNIIDHMNRVLIEGDTVVSDQGTSTGSEPMDTEPWYKRLDVNGNVPQNLMDNRELGPNDKKYPNPDFSRYSSVF